MKNEDLVRPHCPVAYQADGERYTKMPYTRVGHSGVLLPHISLGLWHNFGTEKSIQHSQELIHYAFDHGITHFDLANNYGPPYGSAEATFGQIMKTSLSPYRDELFISTKAGYDMWPGPYGDGGSRKYLMSSLDQSLKRMNLDYVDLFYSHRYDAHTPIEETMQALVDIVRQGKALYVGISRYPREAAQKAYDYLAAHDVPCLIYQGRLNMIDRGDEQDILHQCASHGVGYIGFSPLAQGLLTDRYLHGIPMDSRMAEDHFLKSDMMTPALHQQLLKLQSMANAKSMTIAQLALNWVLSHPEVNSVIVGVSSKEQLADNIQTGAMALLTAAEMQEIDAIFRAD